MSGIVINRQPRQPGPQMPQGQMELQEPPELPEVIASDPASAMMYLPMGLGSASTVLMATNTNANPMMYLSSGLMGVATVGSMVGQMGQSGRERKRRLAGSRRDYLRYLGQIRRHVRDAINDQRRAIAWTHPDPEHLWQLAIGPRLWERRANHRDFAEVRIGLGTRRASLRLTPPQTKPIEDLEPLCASALRRFIYAYASASDLPTAVQMRGFPLLALSGDRAVTTAMTRALVAQLATMHAPEDLRIALIAEPARHAEWDWLKWLPHNAHPSEVDGGGPVRLFASTHDELLQRMGRSMLERPGFEPGATPSPAEPFIVVVSDGAACVPEQALLRTVGMRNAVLVDVTATGEEPYGLVLHVEPELMRVAGGQKTVLGRPDTLSRNRALNLARLLAPFRTPGAGSVDASEPLKSSFDLTQLLNIGDPRTYDVHSLWRRGNRWGNLLVPIGLGAEGQVVALDLKESAQGGMGPHGVLIGATGSGKSELLRTLVIGLAATHSSETLNFVLADFKGGATFLGMEKLPHTSAVITNLADELPLVARAQDALQGEMVRRQQLLRDAGYASLRDYEKARLAGVQMPSLPTLLVIVDEFSELLATKPEFIELFVMIGRLGRSLGVHLLLASQRLDEGRISQLESHLSYRIALRTFSASESRSVIGVPDAHELPSGPGHGYLKPNPTTLVRLKATYVSGPCPSPQAKQETRRVADPVRQRQVVAFTTAPVQLPQSAEPVAEDKPAARTEDKDAPVKESLCDVLIQRLTGSGPLARQIWLPPLAEPPSLDTLLPGIIADANRGIVATNWRSGSVAAPIGVVDHPFEQRRELLIADLSGATGHVGIVGAPQSGKSTMLRTLITALALTHSPLEAQFYCLDFGGGTLASLAAMPHVGSVSSRLDRDRVKRTISELAGLLERREQVFTANAVESMSQYRQMRAAGRINDPYGDVFLVIDGWHTIRQEYEDLEPVIGELAGRGLGFGIHMVIAATRWSEVRPWMRDLIGSRFELKLGDALESEVGTKAAMGVPAVPGRGLTSDGYHFLSAVPRLDGVCSAADLSTVVRDLVEDIATAWAGPCAPEVRLLPDVLPIDQLPPPDGDLRVVLGWDEHRLAPIMHDFEQTPHLLVFGDNETGKTNLLRLLAKQVMARYTPDEAKILLGDFRGGLYDTVPPEYRIGYATNADTLAGLAEKAAISMRARLPGSDITPERLRRRDWWTGPLLYLLIDDYDLASSGMSGPLSPLQDLLAQGVPVGMHLVLARSSSGAMRAMMDPLIRRMWELGNPGLLLSYAKEEGKFLGEAAPRQLPPGRAQLVSRRGIQLVQTGFVPVQQTGA